MFSNKIRRKQACRSAGMAILHSLTCLYLVWTLMFYWEVFEAISCITQLFEWLMVYAFIMLVHALVYFTKVSIWRRAKDPMMQLTRIRVFFHFWVILFEAVWFIYGNTFIYSDETKDCTKKQEFDVTYSNVFEIEDIRLNDLRITVLVYVCIGYLLWLFILLSLCFACVAYKGYLGQNAYT